MHKDREQVQQSEGRAEKYEQELKNLYDQKKNFEHRLYNGDCNSAKEIEGLRNKIYDLESKISELEEEILRIMDLNEDKMQKINQLDGELEGLKKTYKKGYKKYQRTKEEFEKERLGLEEVKKGLTESLEEPLVNKYNQLQNQFNFKGIAKIDDGRCSGCKINIPILQLKSIKGGENKLQSCEHCRRLLVNIETK